MLRLVKIAIRQGWLKRPLFIRLELSLVIHERKTHIVYRDIDGIGYLVLFGHICSFASFKANCSLVVHIYKKRIQFPFGRQTNQTDDCIWHANWLAILYSPCLKSSNLSWMINIKKRNDFFKNNIKRKKRSNQSCRFPFFLLLELYWSFSSSFI
jgi:hypothetical protein